MTTRSVRRRSPPAPDQSRRSWAISGMGANPAPEVHRDHAEHNEHLLAIFEGYLLPQHPEFLDWGIVVTFYAALHYTKFALLRDHGLYAPHHRGHTDGSGAWIAGHNDLVRDNFDANVRGSYKELFDRAQESRYRPFYRKTQSMSAVQQLALYRVHLETVKAACL